MKPLKRLLKHPSVLAALCWLATLYIRFVYATSRWDIVEPEDTIALRDAGAPVVFTFWHSRLMMMHGYPTSHRHIHVLISLHRDGELISRVMHHLGFSTIRGSTSRRGVAALREMLRKLKAGEHVAITPDGPRGPRMRTQMGAISIAKKSGAPIIPLSCAVSRRKMIHSWDRFMLALPFSRGVYSAGAPIYVAADANPDAMEAARLQLEASLNQLTVAADQATGHPTPEPA